MEANNTGTCTLERAWKGGRGYTLARVDSLLDLPPDARETGEKDWRPGTIVACRVAPDVYYLQLEEISLCRVCL